MGFNPLSLVDILAIVNDVIVAGLGRNLTALKLRKNCRVVSAHNFIFSGTHEPAAV
jgi:hypothetical protein